MQMKTHDRKYEIGLVSLFFITWGFVFLDRTSINVLFPVIAEDLQLSNAAIGQINMWTNIAYVFFAIVFSNLADFTKNRKIWLVVAVILTSVMTALSGFASALLFLIIIRMFVGAAEGPVLPLMMTITSKASSPGKFGRNAGVINTGVAVISSTLGPILLTQMLNFVSWRAAFVIISIVSLILGLVIIKFVRSADAEVVENNNEEKQTLGQLFQNFAEVFTYRNVVISMLVSVSALTSLWMIYAYAPTYIVQMSNLSMDKMGFVMSAMGVLSIVWSLLIPAISDFIGRKTTVIIFGFLAIIPPLALFLVPESWIGLTLFIILGGIVGGSAPVFMNIIPVETVPDRIGATSNAFVMGAGDLMGASIMVAVAGKLADIYGLPIVMLIGSIGALLMLLFGFALVETREKKDKIKKAL